MEERKPLSPRTKKAMVYGGIAAVGILIVLATTMGTEKKEPIKEPIETSLTGNADTRSVSIEGLNRRLSDLESGGLRDAEAMQSAMRRLDTQVQNLARSIEITNEQNKTAMNAQIEKAVEAALSRRVPAQTTTPSTNSTLSAADKAEIQRLERERIAAERRAEEAERARKRAEEQRERQADIYRQVAPARTELSIESTPAPKIAAYAAPEPDPVDVREERLAEIPDLNIPAGSILSGYLLTGLDAPTGTRASSSPAPVLLRVKKEAILPNSAFADVVDCHLLGSAYGDLGAERVYIRGETVSCILADNTAVEGEVKFYVAGEDGKNGLRGTLVSRSGRILAAAAGTALADGLLSSLEDSSTESVFLSGASSSSGALSGASEGFDLLTEYYLDLAEQTFPVIEIKNDRWVDVVLTSMLTIKWKG
jgi:conjugal transfer pilus assembly protein TraB